MKVYVCYSATFDGGMGCYREVECVVSSEEAAICWEEDFENNDYEWREYEEFFVLDEAQATE
jgi:hypothetical protein